MSDDEVDEGLLALLRKSLGLDGAHNSGPAETKVLEHAEYIYNNSIDVALDSQGTKAAAAVIWASMQEKSYTFKTWSEHELHPKAKDESTVDFIFIMDLLNFSFWSDNPKPEHRFAVEYRGQIWTGYWSLVAALQRALEEDIPITNPEYWTNQTECTDEVLRHVFRSATDEEIPLLNERISCMREAGKVLQDVSMHLYPHDIIFLIAIEKQFFDGSFLTCIDDANGSATALVNLIVEHFPCFRDEARFEGKTVRLYKRAQILVADLWACFEGRGFGGFFDIDAITMFADYRIPQMLYTLGCLQYSPPLDHHIRQLQPIKSGHTWEIQLRGCSIHAIELIRREILRLHPDAKINAILIDFFLYDSVKVLEEKEDEKGAALMPHHRTRSIWY